MQADKVPLDHEDDEDDDGMYFFVPYFKSRQVWTSAHQTKSKYKTCVGIMSPKEGL
jgi:hypothetical protein